MRYWVSSVLAVLIDDVPVLSLRHLLPETSVSLFLHLSGLLWPRTDGLYHSCLYLHLGRQFFFYFFVISNFYKTHLNIQNYVTSTT